jgi:hypothetical protein
MDGSVGDAGSRLRKPPALSEEERLWIGRWGLLAIIFVVTVYEAWHGWTARDEEDFDLVTYLADASTVLVNLTLLWGVVFGLVFNARLLIKRIVEWVIREWVARSGSTQVRQSSNVGPISVRRVLHKLLLNIVWYPRRWIDKLSHSSHGVQSPAKGNEGPRRVGSRQHAWISGFALAIVVACIVAVAWTLIPRGQSTQTDGVVDAELVDDGPTQINVSLSGCQQQAGELRCPITTGMNPTTLARALSVSDACGQAIWDASKARFPGLTDRNIPDGAYMTVPLECRR